PKRDTPWVAGRGLDAVDGDLDHELGPDEHCNPPSPGLAREQLPRLPLQHLVGETLEALPDHDEPAIDRVAGSEVEVREPALTPPVPPLGAEHDEIVGPYRLQLQPCLAAPAGGVDRVGILDDDTFVPGPEGLVEHPLRFPYVRGDDAGDRELRRNRVQPL